MFGNVIFRGFSGGCVSSRDNRYLRFSVALVINYGWFSLFDLMLKPMLIKQIIPDCIIVAHFQYLQLCTVPRHTELVFWY